MEQWRDKMLKKYDEKEDFRAKKDKKYTDRAGYEAFLQKEVDNDCAAVKVRE